MLSRYSEFRSSTGTTRHNEASLRQVVRDIFFEACELRFSGCVVGAGRSVGSGPGVAAPKSRCSGCDPAALASVSFPACPPGRAGRQQPGRVRLR
jgi:hypothetical protein